MTAAPLGAVFHHADAGTPESAWLGSDRWEGVASLDVAATARGFTDVVVVAAHPDDETLGVGALIAELAAAGVDLHVVVATDGERSHPVTDAAARARLGRTRRQEVTRALATLAPRAGVTHLGLPDTALAAHEERLAALVAGHCRPGTLVLAPWPRDGHGDHDAAGRACAGLAAAGTAVAHYPVWLWHWSGPDELPWQDVVAVEPSRESLWRKRSAVREFRTQLTSRGGPEAWDEDEAAVVGPSVLARAERVVETLLDPRGVLPVRPPAAGGSSGSGRAATFDAMYDDGPDPWGFDGSFYESRRRALVLALLHRERYGRVLEIGCAAGHLTQELVRRADEVVALDTSRRAVAEAAVRAPGARVAVGTAPHDLPDGPFDLVVLAEVGYFLRPLELLSTLRRCVRALAPGGELLLCHWQHATSDIPLDGRLVHDQARSALPGRPSAVAQDEDVVVEAWHGGPSVAVREGRA